MSEIKELFILYNENSFNGSFIKLFKNRKIANISRALMEDNNGNYSHRAFININYWYKTKEADAFIKSLRTNGETRLFYNDFGKSCVICINSAKVFNVNEVKKYSNMNTDTNYNIKGHHIMVNRFIKTDLILNRFSIPIELINIIKEYLYISKYEYDLHISVSGYDTICLYNYVGLRNKNKKLDLELARFMYHPTRIERMCNLLSMEMEDYIDMLF